MSMGELNQVATAEPGPGPWLDEVEQQVLRLAETAGAVINEFLTRHISVEGLSARLRETGAAEVLDEHWAMLIRTPEAAPALEILQLIAFLPDQAEYQVERYGANSLVEDREQLASGLERLTARRHRDAE